MAAHVGGLEDGTILLEQALIIIQMIGIDLEEVAHEWKTLGAGNFSHWLAIYCDGDGVLGGENRYTLNKVESSDWKAALVDT